MGADHRWRDDGRRARLLPGTLLRGMREPTVDMGCSAHGKYVGLTWILRGIGSRRLVSQDRRTNGQSGTLTMVPQRGFALIGMTNSGLTGQWLNHVLTEWALEHYLQLEDV